MCIGVSSWVCLRYYIVYCVVVVELIKCLIRKRWKIRLFFVFDLNKFDIE